MSPRYKSPKKTRGWIFLLWLVDPSRNRLTSTAYFAIIASIILGGLLSRGFCPGGVLSGAFDQLPLLAELREFEEHKKMVPSLFVPGFNGLTNAKFRMKFMDACNLLIESWPNLSNVCFNIESGLFRLNVPTRNIKSAIVFNARLPIGRLAISSPRGSLKFPT